MLQPSFMPAKPSPTPKPAVRSSFPLQENKNLTNEDDPSADMPVKNNLALLRKNFETNEEASATLACLCRPLNPYGPSPGSSIRN